ncbi:MAG: hypothetical protein U0835_19335 [Isosphaeraceae bacterium]
MTATILSLCLISLPSQTPADSPTPPAPEGVADQIVLRDGSYLLGQVERVGRQGELGILARRDWVARNLPERLKVWQRDEQARVLQAKLQRRERLFVWRDVRARGAGNVGVIGSWISGELASIADTRPPRTPLMEIILDRSEVRSMRRQDPETARLLRLGWLAEVDEVEAMPAADLRDALTLQGVALELDPGRVERLLPLRSESDARWRLRRAVTEAVAEPGLRFVRFRWFILPESGPVPDIRPPETTSDLIDSLAAREAFQSILAVRPADPVGLRLNQAAADGRVGAIVSRVEFTGNFDGAEAESSMWVRRDNGTWSVEFTHRATAQVNEPPDPDGPVADAAPIRTALLVLESVAATPSAPGVSRRRQAAGAAAQRALGRARVALDDDLGSAILPVFRRPR